MKKLSKLWEQQKISSLCSEANTHLPYPLGQVNEGWHGLFPFFKLHRKQGGDQSSDSCRMLSRRKTYPDMQAQLAIRTGSFGQLG